VKFLVVDPHLYEKIQDEPGLILGWDVEEIVGKAFPGRFNAHKRARLVQELERALAEPRHQIHAL